MRLLADENFNGRIVRSLLLRHPDLDLLRVQDVGLSGSNDAEMLDWAATEKRLLLTHDYETIPKYALERVLSGLAMPGVIIADTYIATQLAVDDILLLALCSDENEWEGQVLYLPLK